MEQLRENIIKWADDKGILSKATPASQATKILEECLELVVADYNNNQEEIEDACGDIYVTLVIEAHMLGLDLDEVLPVSPTTEALVSLLGSYTPKAILATATNIFGALTEEYDSDYNSVDRFIKVVYHKLVSYCAINDISLEDAVQGAYDIISKRTGRMENGVFVKDR